MADSLNLCKPIVVLSGPTASGKTALAIQLAQAFNGEIIGGDSLQLYQDLPILTARPTHAEMAAAPHHLYGILKPEQQTSAEEWRTWAMAAIAEVNARGRMAIICGGTGLYLNTLIDGLSPVPDIPDDTRRFWRDWVARVGAGAAHQHLKSADPLMATRLKPSDTQRIARALEVIEATGVSLAHWQNQPPQQPGIRSHAVICVLDADRMWLMEQCERRFDKMLQDGAAAEVSDLLQTGIATDAPVFRALGARELVAALSGKLAWNVATERAKIVTRQYAKRQLNWNRTQIGTANRFLAQEKENLLPEIGNIITNFRLTAH